MKEKLAQNMEIQFHLWDVYSKHKEALVDFFVWSFTFYDVF